MSHPVMLLDKKPLDSFFVLLDHWQNVTPMPDMRLKNAILSRLSNPK
jgi:hypothetical protein